MMKRSLCASLLAGMGWIFLASGQTGWGTESAMSTGQKNPASTLIVKAQCCLDAMIKGDFQAAVRDFDAAMLQALGPDKLEQLWKKEIPALAGPFKKQLGARQEACQGYEVVLVTCEFEKGPMDARVVFDKAGKIAGFGFAPVAPPLKYTPPAYADPATFEEQDTTFGLKDWTLPGTLTLPKGEGPFPALVLVHGSGPNNRNEEIGPNRPFQDLAWGLASRGIAVLRYDKRNFVHGAKYQADPTMAARVTVKEEVIEDALEATGLLLKYPKIDPRKVFILGHSLGGYLLPRIARDSKGIAGFLSMAGATQPLEDAILRQSTYLLGLQGGETGEANQKMLQEIREAVSRIKALKPADAGSNVWLLGTTPSYWLDLRGYNPPEDAKKIQAPMLFLQGARDYQVTPEDFQAWKKALGDRKDVAFHFYPKLNHSFFEGEGQSTPAEDELSSNVAPYVVEDIAKWIKGF